MPEKHDGNPELTDQELATLEATVKKLGESNNLAPFCSGISYPQPSLSVVHSYFKNGGYAGGPTG